MKPYQFPVEFQNFTPEQFNDLHCWLDQFSYDVTREKLLAQFGIKISRSKLHRYNQNREFKEEICGEEEFQFDMKAWYDLINANPVPYDEATLKLLSKKVFEYLLHKGNNLTVNGLCMLHRLVTYETTLDLKQRRLALAEYKAGLTPKPRKSKPAPAQPVAQPAPSTQPAPQTKSTPPTSESKSTAPAAKSNLVFPSPLDSIITPPASTPPASPALVTQILRQLPKDLAQKSKFPLAA